MDSSYRCRASDFSIDSPLKQIMLAHSVGFIIFYFSFFLLIAYYLKQRWVAIIYILFLILMVNDTFYWMPSEIPQGIAVLMLYYAFLEKNNASHINRNYILHFFVVLFIQFYHILMVAPILYILVYVVYKESKLEFWAYIKPLIITAFAFVLRYYRGMSDWYEGPKLDIIPALKENIPHFFQLPSVKLFLKFSATDYAFCWTFLVIALATLLVNARFFLSFVLLFFSLGYAVIVCATNPLADKFYLENMLLPLSVFVLLPFADYFLNKLFETPNVFFAVLMAVIVVRLIFIYSAHTVYTTRIEWYEHQLNSMEENNLRRLVVKETTATKDTLIQTWAAGYESLLLSSLEGPAHSKALVIGGNIAHWKGKYVESDTLLLPDWEKASDEVERYYFNMPQGKFVFRED